MTGSRLIELIRRQAAVISQRGIELATVVSPPPALKVRIDNMEIVLEKDDLIVCEGLLEHRIDFTVTEKEEMTVHSRLKQGDRVAVQALPGGQQYLIIDKVVVMGG